MEFWGYGEEDSSDASYTYDEQGRVKTMSIGDGEDTEVTTFNWTVPQVVSGIASIQSQKDGQKTYYSADGVRRQSLHKGLNIVREANGKTKKVILK